MLTSTYRSAGGYKDFSDYRVIDNKIIEFQKREVLDIESIMSDESLNTFKSGSDLRKERNRDLKAVKRDQQPKITNSLLDNKQSKKNKDEIDAIISCLNAAHQLKLPSASIEEKTLGIIDWNLFDKVALDVITNYSEISIKNKLYNWIKFHLRKGDIAFDIVLLSWSWTKKSK